MPIWAIFSALVMLIWMWKVGYIIRSWEQFRSMLYEGVKWLTVFDCHCLRSIANIRCQHHVGNKRIRQRTFGHNDDNLLGVTILKHRWLKHILRMSSQTIQHCWLFADAKTSWKQRCSSHDTFLWYERDRTRLAPLSPSQLSDWCAGDGATVA